MLAANLVQHESNAAALHVCNSLQYKFIKQMGNTTITLSRSVIKPFEIYFHFFLAVNFLHFYPLLFFILSTFK